WTGNDLACAPRLLATAIRQEHAFECGAHERSGIEPGERSDRMSAAMNSPIAPTAPEPHRHFLDELLATFAAHAERPALIFRDRSIPYADLDRRARRCAAWFQRLGVEPGDRVALITGGKLPFLAAHLGAIYAGAVSLPLNPRFTRDELSFFLADSEARVAVVADEPKSVIESLLPELPALRALLADSAAMEIPEAHFATPSIGAEAPCLILYSSGTTGRPKGVVHSHKNLASSLHALRDFWRFSPEDVTVNALPFFHIHGLSFASHLSLLTGGCMQIEE